MNQINNTEQYANLADRLNLLLSKVYKTSYNPDVETYDVTEILKEIIFIQKRMLELMESK